MLSNVTKMPMAFARIGELTGRLGYSELSQAFEVHAHVFGLYNLSSSMSKTRGLGNTGITHSTSIMLVSHGDLMSLFKDAYSGKIHEEIEVHYLHNVEGKNKCLCKIIFKNCLVLLCQPIKSINAASIHANIDELAHLVEQTAKNDVNVTGEYAKYLKSNSLLFQSSLESKVKSSATGIDYHFIVFNYNELHTTYFEYQKNSYKGKHSASAVDPTKRS